MPLFISRYPEPFSVQLEYVKDCIGNTIAVTIPIEIWTGIINRYKDIFVNEDADINNEADHEDLGLYD